MSNHDGSPVLSGDDIEAKIQRQPHLYLRLIQNSLTVAESLRRNYFKNTAEFVRLLRSKVRLAGDTFFFGTDITGLDWPDMRDEVVTFIDGGVGEVRIASQVPLLQIRPFGIDRMTPRVIGGTGGQAEMRERN